MYLENSAMNDADNEKIDEDKTAVNRTDVELYNKQLWQVKDSAEN